MGCGDSPHQGHNKITVAWFVTLNHKMAFKADKRHEIQHKLYDFFFLKKRFRVARLVEYIKRHRKKWMENTRMDPLNTLGLDARARNLNLK